MACERLSNPPHQQALDALLDGELEAEARRELAAHLLACPACAAELAARAQAKRAVKLAAEHRYVPSAQLRHRIEGELSRKEPRANVAIRWLPALVVAAAAVLLAAVWLARRPSVPRSSAVLGELIDQHVAALASANPVDVVSTDLHTVKPWFEGKLPFAVDLPDLAGAPFTLLGGRVVYLDQQPGAGLLFQFRKHRLSVFIFRDKPEWQRLGPAATPERQASFWLESWSANGLRYFVAGDTSAPNVHQLADLMRSAAH